LSKFRTRTAWSRAEGWRGGRRKADRLRDPGLIKSRWEISEEDRRVKVYELARAGREALAQEQEDVRLFAGARERVLGTT